MTTPDLLTERLPELVKRIGQEFDGELHLTEAEAMELFQALQHAQEEIERVRGERDEALNALSDAGIVIINGSPADTGTGAAITIGCAIDVLTALALAAEARIERLTKALEPFARMAEMIAAKPMRGLDDTLHGIHVGTEWEAEIKWSDLHRARAALHPQQGEG